METSQSPAAWPVSLLVIDRSQSPAARPVSVSVSVSSVASTMSVNHHELSEHTEKSALEARLDSPISDPSTFDSRCSARPLV